MLWLGLELRQVGADVLVSPHESIPFLPPCPVVVVAQNLVYHRESFGDPFHGRERRERLRSRLQSGYYRRRMGEAYERAAAIVAVSAHTADVLAERAGLDRAKTTVVLNGSDSDFFPAPSVALRARASSPQRLHARALQEPRGDDRCVRAPATAAAGSAARARRRGLAWLRRRPRTARARARRRRWRRLSRLRSGRRSSPCSTARRSCSSISPSASRSGCRPSRRCGSACRSSPPIARRSPR